MNPLLKTEIVINTKFGGFSLDTEMALYLQEKYGWEIINGDEYDYKKGYDINVLIDHANDYFISPHRNVIEFRSNKELIECIRCLQNKYKDDKHPRIGHIHNFTIKQVKVYLDIIDHYDGIEKIECHMSTDS